MNNETFSEYQNVAMSTAVYNGLYLNFCEKYLSHLNNLIKENQLPKEIINDIETIFKLLDLAYVSLGLTGEAGEVAGKVKKLIRGDTGFEINENSKIEIGKEVGDVLWYVANTAKELEIPMSKIADDNLKKLLSRKERGVLKGSGDNR